MSVNAKIKEPELKNNDILRQNNNQMKQHKLITINAFTI